MRVLRRIVISMLRIASQVLTKDVKYSGSFINVSTAWMRSTPESESVASGGPLTVTHTQSLANSVSHPFCVASRLSHPFTCVKTSVRILLPIRKTSVLDLDYQPHIDLTSHAPVRLCGAHIIGARVLCLCFKRRNRIAAAYR